MNATEREQLRDIFRWAQENGSILWQDVISFDEAWLQEVGVKENRYIDEKRLMQTESIEDIIPTTEYRPSFLETAEKAIKQRIDQRKQYKHSDEERMIHK